MKVKLPLWQNTSQRRRGNGADVLLVPNLDTRRHLNAPVAFTLYVKHQRTDK